MDPQELKGLHPERTTNVAVVISDADEAKTEALHKQIYKPSICVENFAPAEVQFGGGGQPQKTI